MLLLEKPPARYSPDLPSGIFTYRGGTRLYEVLCGISIKTGEKKKQRKKASSTDHMMTLMRGPLNVLRCRADILGTTD